MHRLRSTVVFLRGGGKGNVLSLVPRCLGTRLRCIHAHSTCMWEVPSSKEHVSQTLLSLVSQVVEEPAGRGVVVGCYVTDSGYKLTPHGTDIDNQTNGRLAHLIDV